MEYSSDPQRLHNRAALKIPGVRLGKSCNNEFVQENMSTS